MISQDPSWSLFVGVSARRSSIGCSCLAEPLYTEEFRSHLCVQGREIYAGNGMFILGPIGNDVRVLGLFSGYNSCK